MMFRTYRQLGNHAAKVTLLQLAARRSSYKTSSILRNMAAGMQKNALKMDSVQHSNVPSQKVLVDWIEIQYRSMNIFQL